MRLLPAWSDNLSKRLVKSPKLLLTDTGLMASALGLTRDRLEEEPQLAGPLLEGFVLLEVRKQATWSETRPELFSRAECASAVERFTDAIAHAVIANSKVSPLSMSDARSRAEDGRGGSQGRSPGTAASSSLGHRGQIGLELDQEILQRLRENG